MQRHLLRAVWLLIIALAIFSAIVVAYAWLLAWQVNEIPTDWGKDLQGPWGNHVRLRTFLSYALRAAVAAAILAILSLVLSQTKQAIRGVALVVCYTILLIASHGWLTWHQW